jgi:hypothetical protein
MSIPIRRNTCPPLAATNDLGASHFRLALQCRVQQWLAQTIRFQAVIDAIHVVEMMGSISD